MTKFSWNEGIDTCFNVECVLLGRNFDFLGGYCSSWYNKHDVITSTFSEWKQTVILTIDENISHLSTKLRTESNKHIKTKRLNSH